MSHSEYEHSLTFRVRRCCYSNETRAPIANPSNSAQLEGTPYHSPLNRVREVAWECDEGQTHTQTDTQTAVTTIHFASATPYAKCNKRVTERRRNTKESKSLYVTVAVFVKHQKY